MSIDNPIIMPMQKKGEETIKTPINTRGKSLRNIYDVKVNRIIKKRKK
tara:strand:+ start:3400 stop:3543 length:144 start_codon:yes stop_codon:yes gene_type:complete